MKVKILLCLLVMLIFLPVATSSTLKAQGKVINLATEPAWIPYFGKDLKNGGLMVDIAREAFKKKGYTIKMKWLPWKRAMEMTFTGKYDGLVGCYYTEERAKKLDYSEALTSADVILFQLKKRGIKYKKLTDLAPYSIGVGRGYANTEEFDNADYLKKEEGKDTHQNIKKLLNGRVDLIIDSRKVVLHIMKQDFKNEVNDIEALEPPLKSKPIHIGFSKKNPNYKQIVKDFNEGLKMIKKDGSYNKILKSHGF